MKQYKTAGRNIVCGICCHRKGEWREFLGSGDLFDNQYSASSYSPDIREDFIEILLAPHGSRVI
jgi:hypothetical protein